MSLSQRTACFSTLLVLVLATAASAQFPPNQPFASFWFPKDLLAWNPETDPDAPYNRSAVPLADRFVDAKTQANSHARAGEGLITNLAVMYPTTSNNPSQGALDFDSYAFNYWQYIDGLVFFGGSAGEGLILAPNSGVIDAGHRHGVPVLGNIFFPPNVFGGQIQWVRDFAVRDGNTFPVADKLIEVAEYYGFDGWFINQETSGGDSVLADDLQEMMAYMEENSDILVMWYDSMIESGSIFYQNELNTLNDEFFDDLGVISGGMFLNYNWSNQDLIDSADLAASFGRTPYSIFAGANVGPNGYNTFVNWNSIFPEGEPHRLSLSFFGNQWTWESSSNNDDFYARMRQFWSGPNLDPSNTDTSDDWKGLAHYVPAKSTINDLPFVSNFNTGHGQLYAIDGEVLSDNDWNNRGLQDVLPTWRWINRTSGSPLDIGMIWSDAYYGGTSLRISGDLDAPNNIGLFKTRLDVTAETSLEVAYKTGEVGSSDLQIGLLLDGPTPRFEFLDVGPTTGADWNLATIDLEPFAGRTVLLVALRVEAPAPIADYEILVGRVGFLDGTRDQPAPASAVVIEDKAETDPQTAALRVRWTASTSPVYVYNVYRQNPDGSRTHLGSSPSDAYFVPEVLRAGSETTTTIEVEAVSAEFGHSPAALATFEWDTR